MPIGDATKAQAAADMVARIETAALAAAGQSTALWKNVVPMTSTQAGNATPQWAERVAADTDAANWTFIGLISQVMVILRNNTDGRWYVVMRDPAGSWYATHKATFNTLAAEGRSWIPAFTLYDTPKVYAIDPHDLAAQTGDPNAYGTAALRAEMGLRIGSIRAGLIGTDIAGGATALRLLAAPWGQRGSTIPVSHPWDTGTPPGSGSWTPADARSGVTGTVVNKSLTSNVATLTLSTGHGFGVGDFVTVAGVGAPFDGTATLTAVTSTTVSYAKTNANIASTAATGTVTL